MTSSNPSRSEPWQNVRDTEDLLAILHRIDVRRRVIRTHAWREGSWDAVYTESTKMRDDIAGLKDSLSTNWRRLHAAAQGREPQKEG